MFAIHAGRACDGAQGTGGAQGSLLGMFGKLHTTCGTRELRLRVLSPLMDRQRIDARLDLVQYMHDNVHLGLLGHTLICRC